MDHGHVSKLRHSQYKATHYWVWVRHPHGSWSHPHNDNVSPDPDFRFAGDWWFCHNVVFSCSVPHWLRNGSRLLRRLKRAYVSMSELSLMYQFVRYFYEVPCVDYIVISFHMYNIRGNVLLFIGRTILNDVVMIIKNSSQSMYRVAIMKQHVVLDISKCGTRVYHSHSISSSWKKHRLKSILYYILYIHLIAFLIFYRLRHLYPILLSWGGVPIFLCLSGYIKLQVFWWYWIIFCCWLDSITNTIEVLHHLTGFS